MHCTQCGLKNLEGSRFCAQCGCSIQRDVKEHNDDTSMKLSEALRMEANANDDNTKAEVNLKYIQKFMRSGALIYAIFALICLVVGIIYGFTPIFLIAGIVFGLLSWLLVWRWPLSTVWHSALLALVIAIAVTVGIAFDQDAFGVRYRYLSKGNNELRIDERKGRTDQLEVNGWHPIAFDKEAVSLPPDENNSVALDKGAWKSNYGSGEICFNVINSSRYVINRITITVSVNDESGNIQKDVSDEKYGWMYLNNRGVTILTANKLIDVGETSEVCATKPRGLNGKETWSYDHAVSWGWLK